MKRVVLGDECVRAPAGGAPDAALIRPGAAAALARLSQADCTVVLASHFLPAPQGAATDASPAALRHDFWHALAHDGAHANAVFFWPDGDASGDQRLALFDEIATRYGTETGAWQALFADAEALRAAHAAGCHAIAVALPGVAPAALPPGVAPAADLATCVARIVDQPDARAAHRRADDAPTPAAAA